VLRFTGMVSEAGSISRLGSSVRAVNDVLQAIGILKEVCVSDVVIFISIHQGNCSDFFFAQRESQSVKDLSELLRSDFEVLVLVEVLEETLCMESVSAHDFTESAHNFVNANLIVFDRNLTTVVGFLSCVTKRLVKFLFEAFLGEYLIDLVAEISPSNVFSFLRCLEVVAQHLEFFSRDWKLSHV